ncbi:hypothetical protein LZD49_20340 [Dyadobacter sp. CY261]|uniref:hypothetical protein n=1 Tax=Dyadobacter sp. CY261 TaxID=2907203 RepID=UPI001F3F9C1B|nr:hypothetical protein [Dyadobacter sp. CY261]MCF0072841.1 hypothetical protein [Dyadobacter sp. CY261]
MNERDKRIQAWLDLNSPAPLDSDNATKEDLKAYELVFGALNKEPAKGLSYGLSFRVERLIFKKKQQARQKLLYMLLSLVALLLIIGAAFIWQHPSIANLPQILPGTYLWPLCFGTGTALLIQFLEYRRLRKKWLASSMD